LRTWPNDGGVVGERFVPEAFGVRKAAQPVAAALVTKNVTAADVAIVKARLKG